MAKSNNKRRFPGESNKHRPDRAAQRREDAIMRQEYISSKTPEERLELLDVKLGTNQGAVKERARLLKQIQSSKSNQHSKQTKKVNVDKLETALLPDHIMEEVALPDHIMEEINALNDTSGKKKLKAKERRAKNNKSND